MTVKKFAQQKLQHCVDVLDAFAHSGLSTQAFAQAQGLNYGQLRGWLAHGPRWRAQLAGEVYVPARRTSGTKDSDQINLTDEESRIMPLSGGGFEQCYNAQAGVDAQPMLKVLQEQSAKLGTVTPLIAETGYCSEKNVVACDEAKIVPLIAVARQDHHLEAALAALAAFRDVAAGLPASNALPSALTQGCECLFATKTIAARARVDWARRKKRLKNRRSLKRCGWQKRPIQAAQIQRGCFRRRARPAARLPLLQSRHHARPA